MAPRYVPAPAAGSTLCRSTALNSAASNNSVACSHVNRCADANAAPDIAVHSPSDAVTTSGSGLDPHVSPANALRQAARIAAARGALEADVSKVIAAHMTPPVLGFIGQPTVNVLETNLALDAALPKGKPGSR